MSEDMNKQFREQKDQQNQQMYQKMLSFTSCQEHAELSTTRNIFLCILLSKKISDSEFMEEIVTLRH